MVIKAKERTTTFIDLHETVDYHGDPMFYGEADLNGAYYYLVIKNPTQKWIDQGTAKWVIVYDSAKEFEAARKNEMIVGDDLQKRRPTSMTMVWLKERKTIDDSGNEISNKISGAFNDDVHKKMYWVGFGTQKKDPTKYWLSFNEGEYKAKEETKKKDEDELPF